MRPSRIPLFPLEVVLFPGMPLPLHIFEPRYKLMIARCLEELAVFGIVMAHKDEMANVGCTAEIAKVVQRYADGRVDIVTVGRDVCSIREVLNEEPYSEAIVDYLEEPPLSPLQFQSAELLDVFQQCHEMIYNQKLDLEESDKQMHVSYRLASELPIELSFKQELLEMRSEIERRTRLLAHLQEWVPRLQRVERVRKKAASNGHSRV